MKKTLSIFLTVLMVLSLVPFAALSAFAEDEAPPIEVRTVADLYAVRNKLDGNYILMNDIDLTEATAEGGDYDNNGHGWAPIGENSDLAFTGVFDGNGYSIIGMRIYNHSSSSYVGLFGYVKGVIKNLTMENVSISVNKYYCGAVCAILAENAEMLRCKVSGSIRNSGYSYTHYTGGLVGEAIGTVTECVNSANILGTGSSSGNNPSSCDIFVGGITGYAGVTTISSCVNTGTVHNTCTKPYPYAAGICGWGEGTTVQYCINIGSITNDYRYQYSSYDYARAILHGSNYTINKNYFLIGSASTGGGDSATTCVALSAAQMLLESSFGYLDFENTWFIDPGLGVTHPQLKNNPEVFPDSISVAQPATKLTYTHHEPLDVSGMTINVQKDDISYEIAVTPDMISGYEEASVGPRTMTVSYLGKSTTYNIFILELPVDEIALNYEEFDVDIGSTVQLTASFTPENATDTTATYVSSNPDIATVDENGLVTGVDRGDAVITATAASGVEAFCTVHVQKPATAMRFEKSSLVLNAGETGSFGVIFTPEDATDAVTWSSANENIATVDENGVVTGVEYGKTTITGTTTRGLIYGGTVNVRSHAFGEYVFNNDATCLEDGTMTAHCLYCDAVDTVTDEGTALGHNYLAVKSNPTCTEAGFTSHFCTRCGNSFTDGHTDATGHIYISKVGDDYLASPATCSKAATYYKSCYSCGAPSEETFSYGSPLRHKYTAEIVNADCENDGYTRYTCAKCGDSYIGNTVPALGHEYAEEWTIETPATCTTDGVKSRHCIRCGEAGDITGIPATGHRFGAWASLDENSHQRVCAIDPTHTETEEHRWDDGEIAAAATCETDGIKVYTCGVCGAQKTEILPATGHEFGAWTKLDATYHQRVCANDAGHTEKEAHAWDAGKITKDPTCTTAGVKTYTCAVCKATKTESIPKTGHAYGAWTKLDATYHQRVCANNAAHIEKAEHSWNAGKITKDPTCTTAGVKTYTCTVCKATKTETIAKTGHAYGAWTKLDATYHQRVCANNESHTQKEEHTWNAGKVTKAATCTTAGVKTYTCTACKATKTETVAKLGHNYSTSWTVDKAATCTAAGSKSHHCTRCTAKADVTSIPATGHTWDAGVVTTAATTTAEGVKTFTCSVCGATKTEAIPKALAKIAVTAANTASGVKLSWKKDANADGYYVYRKTGSGSYSLIKTISGNTTITYTDTAVKSRNGVAYTYCVKSYRGTEKGTYTAKKIYRLTGVAISSLTNSAAGRITVKWAENAKATGYQIQYATNSKFTSAKTIAVTDAATLAKTISSLTVGSTYYVRVRAYKTVSSVKYYSAWSAAKSVKIAK
ncbi:MAG: Ig-like domain-containing protein [Clostridia bacterium]|nr:Ig-like domain-containing protein [Clostridia bacterium]